MQICLMSTLDLKSNWRQFPSLKTRTSSLSISSTPAICQRFSARHGGKKERVRSRSSVRRAVRRQRHAQQTDKAFLLALRPLLHIAVDGAQRLVLVHHGLERLVRRDARHDLPLQMHQLFLARPGVFRPQRPKPRVKRGVQPLRLRRKPLRDGLPPEPLPRHLQPAAGGLNLRYALWICHVRNSRYLPS